MEMHETLFQAKENRVKDNLNEYLKYYYLLFENMTSDEICKEVILGELYLFSKGEKEKIVRYLYLAGHPLRVFAEFIDLLFGTTETEFKKEFPIWLEKTEYQAAMKAWIRFHDNSKNDKSLESLDAKAIRALGYIDDKSVYLILEKTHRENDKKVPGIGARSKRRATACLKALEKLGTPRALQSLFQIQQYARYAKPDESIKNVLLLLNLSETEIEELKTPTYGFNSQLTRIDSIGDLTIIMKILPDYRIERTITDIEGNEYKKFPKSVLAEIKDEIRDLKELEKAIIQSLRFHRDRIEKTYRTGQNWNFTDWLRSYMLHPLVGYSARRLIWEFFSESGNRMTGLWADSQMINEECTFTFLDAFGNPLSDINDDWKVKLWHPVESSKEQHLAWMNRVMALKVVQPFKQAFREIYTLSQPELETKIYSNRFAAHILYKQQFAAIANSRGWHVTDYFSDECSYDFPGVMIQGHYVEFRMDADCHFGTNTTTDVIVFDQYADLTSIPPIVFSESLRDADLFVSVCSIGVDPNWTPDKAGYEYWLYYTSRDLSDSSINRKDVLERTLPTLSISNKCRIEDRWFIVEGKLSTYRIHIGSGSVYKEPSGSHICIVSQNSGKSEADKVYLPFESDFMISLILSKAFLLANDISIKDPSILNQIKTEDA